MPALCRPEVLAATLWSFDRGLFRHYQRKTLIINVDPLGASTDLIAQKHQRIHDLVNRYFGRVIIRQSDTPNFSVAVHWIWQQLIAIQHQEEAVSYFLHLEDDWVLNRAVPIAPVDALLSQPKIASLRLQRQRHPVTDRRLSLNPVFLNTAFIRQALLHFQLDKDPEKQFSMEPLISILSDWQHLTMPDDSGGWVSDIGVHWRRSQNLEKIAERGVSRWQVGKSSRASIVRGWLVLRFKLFLYRTRVLLMDKNWIS